MCVWAGGAGGGGALVHRRARRGADEEHAGVVDDAALDIPRRRGPARPAGRARPGRRRPGPPDRADAAREQPAWTAWRCIVTDDVHGSVLGVTDPIWTPRHDPPPRLTRLVTAMEPVCVFPGCRTPAPGRCDIDHRIPYTHDPGDPAGERGGGRTCSCKLQALCRAHHQQKTAGALP